MRPRRCRELAARAAAVGHAGRVALTFVLVAFATAAVGSPQDGSNGPDGPGIPAELDRILAHPTLRGSRVGIVVRDVENGELLAVRDGDGRYAPASVTKVFTAATALERLGPSFVWQTPITYRGDLDDALRLP